MLYFKIICIYLGGRGMNDGESVMNQSGVIWSVAAGIFVGLAEILSFCVNGYGVPTGYAEYSCHYWAGGTRSVFFGTVLGSIFSREDVSYRGWLGVFPITLGIGIVSMELGMKSH